MSFVLIHKTKSLPQGCKRSPWSRDLLEPHPVPANSSNSTPCSCPPKVFTQWTAPPHMIKMMKNVARHDFRHRKFSTALDIFLILDIYWKSPGFWRSRKTSLRPSQNIHRHPSEQAATAWGTPPGRIFIGEKSENTIHRWGQSSPRGRHCPGSILQRTSNGNGLEPFENIKDL